MHRSRARRLLLVALGIGVVAEVGFYDSAAGLNVPVFVGLVLAAGWAFRRAGRAPDPLDAWLPIAAMVFAVFVAVRADPFVAALDIIAAFVLTGASVAAFSGLAVTRRSASVVLAIGAWVVEGALIGTGRAMRTARPAPRDEPRQAPPWLGGLGRGLFLAIPIVLIFAVLFASADPIFRRAMEDVLHFQVDLGDFPGRLVIVVAVAWLVGGLLSVAAAGLPELERSSLGAAARGVVAARPGRPIGAVEAIVVLVAVDLVVLVFVGLQVAYLFGGLDTLAAAGMTYADYARRGYFELVAAAALAGGLLVVLELAVDQRSRAYVALAVALVGLTVVVLASAAMRLGLYQVAYGWTELRLYVAISIVALAGTLALLAVLLVRDRTHWLGHGIAVIGLASLLALNVLAPAAFVADRNVERVLDPSLVPPGGSTGLDVEYLGDLPDDAVPTLVDALPGLPDPDRALVLAQLQWRRHQLRSDPTLAGPAAWNLGRERARAALATLP